MSLKHREKDLRHASAAAHFSHACALQQAGYFPEAVKSYRLGLAFQPDSPEVLSNLGCLLDDLGSRDEAESVHRRAVALAPNVAVMHNNLGLTLQSLGKTEEAEACFRKAIELRADWPVARLNLGRLLQMNERHADSIEHYEHVLEIDPSNARAKNNLGIAREHLGDLAGATAAFQAAIAADAGLVAAHRRLAEVQQRQVPLWHISMLNDHARNEAYQGALRTAIDSDSRVLEIGTGAGLLSMFAARMGPKSLTTCEAEPLVAQMASKVIENNGLASRISRRPPSDQRALRPPFLLQNLDLHDQLADAPIGLVELLGERVLASIEDAKLRLLQPGCRIIPASASLMIALFGGERLASNLSVETVEGLDLSAFNQVITRRQMLARDDLEIELLGDETEAFRFDFEQQKEWVPQCTQIRIPVTVEGRCYGIVQWLRLRVDRITTFENHPRAQTATSHWRPALYLMPEPVNIRPGQTAVVRAMHDRVSPWFTVERFD